MQKRDSMKVITTRVWETLEFSFQTIPNYKLNSKVQSSKLEIHQIFFQKLRCFFEWKDPLWIFFQGRKRNGSSSTFWVNTKWKKLLLLFCHAIHRQMLLDLAKLCQFSHLSAANWYYYRHKKKVLHLVIILGYRGRNRLEFSHFCCSFEVFRLE